MKKSRCSDKMKEMEMVEIYTKIKRRNCKEKVVGFESTDYGAQNEWRRTVERGTRKAWREV